MPFCGKCGKELPPDADFCPNCGSPTVRSTVTSTGLKPIGLGSRAVAAIIDHIIIFITAMILRLAVAALTFPFFWTFDMNAYFGLFGLNWLLWILYFTYFEGSQGQTPAKRWLNIKVVRENGSTIDYTTALIRNILRIIDALPIVYILGAILIAVSEKRQRLGDIIAKTLVISA